MADLDDDRLHRSDLDGAVDGALGAAREALARYTERRDWCADYALRRDRILHRYRPSGPRGEDGSPHALGRVSDEAARKGIALAQLAQRWADWEPEVAAVSDALARASAAQRTIAQMRYLGAEEATWEAVAEALGVSRTKCFALHRDLLRLVAMWLGLLDD